MYEVDVLKWATGSIKPMPSIEALDEEYLLGLVWYHGLTGRFLRRMHQEPQPWMTTSLRRGLMVQLLRTQQVVRSNIEAVREIIMADSAAGQPLITVKGYSTYALTGDALTMRYSGDIDVLCRDPRRLVEILSRLGYSIAESDMGGPATHELAVLTKASIVIEIHRYFPVKNFPAAMNIADLEPASNPGMWHQSIHSQHNQIKYDDLLEHSIQSTVADTKDLAVPNPTMSAFIACAHALGNVKWLLPGKRNRLVHLAELAEICDLVRHPKFDLQTFHEIEDRFRGHYATHFIGRLIKEYLGFNPLPRSHKDQSLDEFPHPREYRHFVITVPWSPDKLLTQERTPDIEELVDHLGANTIVAGNSLQDYCYAALISRAGEKVERVLTGGLGEQKLPIVFSVAWQEDALGVDVWVPSKPRGRFQGIRVECSDVFCQWFLELPESKVSRWGTYGEVAARFDEHGHTVRFVFPWNLSRDLSPRQRSIPMLISALRWGAGREMDTLASTLVPLIVTPEPG